MEFLAFFLAAENPVLLYVQRVFMKDPFQGIYQPNGFDLLLLIPYFGLLAALALYGLHRYYLVYAYYRHRENRPAPPAGPLHPLPRVTVQLPLYNERYVVERLIEEVCRTEYPRELLEIQVLDDSTDETSELARLSVERYAALGFPIHYYHRDHREGFKAGALAEGLRQATGEFIALFDADFLPPPDFLQKTLPYFHDPKIGMVQTRWNYINRGYSLLTRVEGILLDGHFVLEHGARSRSGCFFNFNGTAGIWRRCAIEEAGGWQHDTLTEDTDLSYRAQLQGWKFLYLPEIECFSELPVEVNAFKSQQARWAKGLIQTGRKLLPTLWRSREPLRVKIEATFHLTANICYPLMSLMAALLLPAIIVRFYQGWFQMLYIDLPLLLACTCSVFTFYLTAQRELCPKDWKSSIKYMPLLMMAGLGLAVNNSRAVLEALFGVRSEFVRTAKYRIEARHARVVNRKYRHRTQWMAYLEILLGCYFIFALYYAASNGYYLTVPFLFLFVGGYLGAGLLSLFQDQWEKLEISWSQKLATLFRPVAKGFQQP
ncbi:MAG: glycosyl transferase family 2 [Acidobacteria bacterium RIFCSPLOWO2_02_FULL_59_13]|nr:MAG: glycosyl transferase family 2 [Acidobacteria bacterium RIFCSPLOWO2_02_FULL_59_13]